jgi:hypothetical protein
MANGNCQLLAKKTARQQVWVVTLIQTDQSLSETDTELSKYDDYYLVPLGKQDTVIYRIKQTKRERLLALSY